MYARWGISIALAAGMAMTAGERKDTFDVQVTVNAAHTTGPLKPIWRFFGADEPNYATMRNGKKLLGDLGALKPQNVYFRAHNLLTTGDGKPALKWGSTNAYTEDANGKPLYNWRILDRIFDTYRKQGIYPYAQIGFMPKALSTHPEPYQHSWTPKAKYNEIYTGWAYPPKDYDKWSELAYQWAKHCVERYGIEDVRHWYWETWNEANIGYWQGTREEFFKLHDYAIAGIKRAIPDARVGGPDSAGGGAFLKAFIEHCLANRSPLDFVSFHAKGAPEFVDGHVRMGIAAQLKGIDDNFRLIGSFPQLKKTPIVIGESDPDGCAACQGPQLGYRNGTMFSSYTAAVFARKLDLADKHGVNLEGALTWAFTFEDQPYFAGFRQLASMGIDLPVLNVFRMYSKMGSDRLEATSDTQRPLEDIVNHGVRNAPDVGALASREGSKLAVMLWHYHDDDTPGPTASVTLNLTGLTTGTARYTEYRIDESHSNSFTAWQAMGSPAQPTKEQIAALTKAGKLQKTSIGRLSISNHFATLKTELPRKAVALFVIE